MNKPIQLSLEKQLIHRNFETKVERMNLEQAREFCLRLHHLMLCKDQVTAEVMKKDIGSMFNGYM